MAAWIAAPAQHSAFWESANMRGMLPSNESTCASPRTRLSGDRRTGPSEGAPQRLLRTVGFNISPKALKPDGSDSQGTASWGAAGKLLSAF